MDLIQQALLTDAGVAIKRAITPLLADSFPQFPEFTNISLGDTDESGTTTVTLRQPPKPKAASVPKSTKPKVDSPLKSMEPLEVTEPVPVEDEL